MGIWKSSTAAPAEERIEAVVCAACKQTPKPVPVAVKVAGIEEMQTVCSDPRRCREQAQAAGIWCAA